MVTFILAVVFWPITLIYGLVVYVLPPIFFITFSIVSSYPIPSLIAFVVLLYVSTRNTHSTNEKLSIDAVIKEKPIIEINKAVSHHHVEEKFCEKGNMKAEVLNPELGGAFISSKGQVIELLREMDASDKAKLLKNLRLRNPTLAKELTESCLSFESIWDLDKEGLRNIVVKTKPAILGLALSLVSESKQFRALSLLSEDVAVRAFEIMQKDLTSYRSECFRAQQKILELAISLQRKRVIQFY